MQSLKLLIIEDEFLANLHKMAVKIRLQRHGKKGKPFYYIVVADSRVKRDGKFIDRIGSYNPITNPATIELDVDAAVKWLENGAQPTDTARAILSYKGALLKKHLKGGVAKGAFSEEEMEKKFANWLEEKAKLVQAKVDGLAQSKADKKKAAMEAEVKLNEARIAAAQVVEQEVAPATESEETQTTEAEAVTEVEEPTTESTSEEVSENS